MCSRYYIDPNMMEEISRVVQNIDGRIRLTQGDIRPTDVAPVIGQSEHGLELGICRWGYPLSKGKNPVINARVETVMDKPSFQNGILYHRLLIPAGGFYEWNSLKEKVLQEEVSRFHVRWIYMECSVSSSEPASARMR